MSTAMSSPSRPSAIHTDVGHHQPIGTPEPEMIRPRRPRRVFKHPSGPVGQFKFLCCGLSLVGNDRAKLLMTIVMFGTFFGLVLAYPAWDLSHRHRLWTHGDVPYYFIMCCTLGFFTFFFLYLTAFRDPGIIRRQDGRTPPRPPSPPPPTPLPPVQEERAEGEANEGQDTPTSVVDKTRVSHTPYNSPTVATSTQAMPEHGVRLNTLPQSTPMRPRRPYCYTCQAYTPPRSAHCSVCDACIRRLDHHCKFVGTCIGERNYRYFFIYLGLKSIAATVGLITCITDMVYTAALYQQAGQTRWKWFASSMSQEPALAVVNWASGLFCLVWSVNLILLFSYHVYLVATNTTTREHIKEIHKHGNIFDTGSCLGNFREVLGAPIPRSKVAEFSGWSHERMQRWMRENAPQAASPVSRHVAYDATPDGDGRGGDGRGGHGKQRKGGAPRVDMDEGKTPLLGDDTV